MGKCVAAAAIVLLLIGIFLPNMNKPFGPRYRFHPVTGESERQRVWLGFVVGREREEASSWYATHCGAGSAATDDPLWRSGDGGTIYGGTRINLWTILLDLERCDVSQEDRCRVVRYVLEHPTELVWELVDEREGWLEWGVGKEAVMRWERGKGLVMPTAKN